MKPTIGKYKLTPPATEKIVPRPHLLELLDLNQSKRLSIILGQAAQGKSTLAAAFFNTVNYSKVWINLDQEDAEPIDFYYTLVYALKPFLKGAEFDLLYSYPTTSLGLRADILMYRDWVKTLFEKITPQFLIILDGLDQITNDAPVFKLISVLLEEASSETRFILTSRNEPPVDMRKMQIRRECFVIHNEMLAFSLDEINAFYNNIYDLPLDSKAIKQIYRLSEGWVGGLVLLGEILLRMPKVSHEKYLSHGLTEIFKTEVFEYLSEEVFNRVPVYFQELYIKSAIFDFIEPKVLKSVLRLRGANDFFENVVKRNMFAQVVYSNDEEIGIRYHKLFHDFLKSKFKHTLEPAERRKLHLNTSQYYEKIGNLESATIHYLKAEAYKEAARAIEKVGQSLLNSGRAPDLLKWIVQLPQELIRINPWILLFHAMCLRFTETTENAKRIIDARRLFKNKNDAKGLILALSLLIETSILIGRDVIPLMEIISEGEALLESVDTDAYLEEKAALWSQIGWAYNVRVGNFKKSINACYQACVIAKKIGILPLQIYAQAGELGSYSLIGDFDASKKVIKNTEKVLNQLKSQEVNTFFNLTRIEFLLIKGDLLEAKKVLEKSQFEAEKLGLIYLIPAIQFHLLWLKPHIGEFEDVPKIAEPLIAFLSNNKNYFHHGVVLLYEGINYYHQGSYEKAKEAILKAIHILSKKDLDTPAQYYFAHFILGMTYYNLNKPKKAKIAFDEFIAYEIELESVLFHVHIQLGLGLLYWQEKRVEHAIQYISKGFRLAKENGYVFMMWMKKEDFARACIGAIELKINEVVEYATYLLETRLGSTAENDLKRLSKSKDAQIKSKAISIRKTIYRSNLKRLKIRTFAGFQVYRGETQLEDTDWKRKSAKLLLKAIVSCGPGGIPKDVLMEDLWPESKPTAAENNFKVTLHRLRKILEPDMDREFGSAFIQYKDDLITLDEKLCSIDSSIFLDHIKQGNKYEIRKDMKNAILHYKKAVDLYLGDFLPEDLYKNSIERKRSELKQRLIDTLLRLAKIYENRGAAQKAIRYYQRVTSHDLVMEYAYQRLMVLYSDTGQLSKASKTYHLINQILEKELDTEPSTLTKSLYNKIYEKKKS